MQRNNMYEEIRKTDRIGTIGLIVIIVLGAIALLYTTAQKDKADMATYDNCLTQYKQDNPADFQTYMEECFEK